MRTKYHTLEEYRAANALRQKKWRRKRKASLGVKSLKRGRKAKHTKKRGLELAIN